MPEGQNVWERFEMNWSKPISAERCEKASESKNCKKFITKKIIHDQTFNVSSLDKSLAIVKFSINAIIIDLPFFNVSGCFSLLSA